jgi:hypothetical protein
MVVITICVKTDAALPPGGGIVHAKPKASTLRLDFPGKSRIRGVVGKQQTGYHRKRSIFFLRSILADIKIS